MIMIIILVKDVGTNLIKTKISLLSNMAHKITVIGTIRLNDLQILQITGI